MILIKFASEHLDTSLILDSPDNTLFQIIPIILLLPSLLRQLCSCAPSTND